MEEKTQKKETKSKKVKEVRTVQVKVVPIGEEYDDTPYPNIKRMISTLDKFLIRRIAIIAMCYVAGMIVLGSCLTVSGVASSANANGNGLAIKELNIWLYSLAAVLTFLFILVAIRFIVAKVAQKKDKKTA